MFYLVQCHGWISILSVTGGAPGRAPDAFHPRAREPFGRRRRARRTRARMAYDRARLPVASRKPTARARAHTQNSLISFLSNLSCMHAWTGIFRNLVLDVLDLSSAGYEKFVWMLAYAAVAAALSDS